MGELGGAVGYVVAALVGERNDDLLQQTQGLVDVLRFLGESALA